MNLITYRTHTHTHLLVVPLFLSNTHTPDKDILLAIELNNEKFKAIFRLPLSFLPN